MSTVSQDLPFWYLTFTRLGDRWVVYQNLWTDPRLIATNYVLQGWQASNGIRFASKNSPAWVGNTLYLEGGFPNFSRKPVLLQIPFGQSFKGWLYPIEKAAAEFHKLHDPVANWKVLPYDEADHA